MQPCHHKGPIHTSPYGEVPKITNHFRDWVFMTQTFTVPFETDPDTVRKLFMQIGKVMAEPGRQGYGRGRRGPREALNAPAPARAPRSCPIGCVRFGAVMPTG